MYEAAPVIGMTDKHSGCSKKVMLTLYIKRVSLSKKIYPHCFLVLVGPRNGFEHDLLKHTLRVSQSDVLHTCIPKLKIDIQIHSPIILRSR